MSDFVNDFWSGYVAILTVVSILACLWLLWVAGKHRVSKTAQATQDNTTGHVWDEDLQELNNPLPRWWMWLFILTVVFSLGYLVVFPGLGSYAGTGQWSSKAEHGQDAAVLRASSDKVFAGFAGLPGENLRNNPDALALGERMFLNNCAQCHGSDGRGSKGFPDLTQPASAWLGDKSPAYIERTISEGRNGTMPPMTAALGGDEDTARDVASYVLSLSGSLHDKRRVSDGQAKFAVCAGCHGADGAGNKVLGAPSLADGYWLHGRGETAVLAMIRNGKQSVMPAHASKFTPAQIHVLAGYVLSLSAPEAQATAASGKP